MDVLNALSMSPVALADLAPALVYLALVSVVALRGKSVSLRAHLVLATAGVGVRVVQDGPVEAAISVAGATIAFFFLVMTAYKVLSRVGLFSIVMSLALLPILAWPALGAGLLIAATVGTIQTIRVVGVARVHMLTNETFAAMGVNAAGTFQKPDFDRLPSHEDTAQFVTNDKDARRMQLTLPPYLLGGLGIGVAWILIAS